MGRASAVGRASDVAVEWEGLVLTWHAVFVGRASGSPSGRGATGDTLSWVTWKREQSGYRLIESNRI